MVYCNCGAKFKDHIEFRIHLSLLCPTIQLQISVIRGWITEEQRQKAIVRHELFTQKHFEIRKENK